MSERKVTDSPHGLRVLAKLREERWSAIDQLSNSKSKKKDSHCSTFSGRSSEKSSAIPVVQVNSMKVDSLGGNTILDYIKPLSSHLGSFEEMTSTETELSSVFEDEEKIDSEIAITQSNIDEQNQTRGTQCRGSPKSLLDIPGSRSTQWRREVFTNTSADCNGPLHEVQGTMNSSPGVPSFVNRQSSGRSRSPLLSRNNSGQTRSSSHSSISPVKLSPLSSPDVSPSLPRRRTSLTLPIPETFGKSCQRPPTNTEERLQTRSAHYKLQRFLDKTKSQLTTAQTLELNATAATNADAKI